MTESEICCQGFDPTPFDLKEHVWENKLFVKDSMRTFMHMPLFNVFGKTLHRILKKVEKAGAKPEDKDFLLLCTDPSPWKSELYMNATKEVPDGENVRLSGTYLSKVYDGPYKDIRKWITDLQNHVKAAGKEVKNLYFYYATCPKCAKEMGHNYVIGFAQVD